jgi:hypothetical protein
MAAGIILMILGAIGLVVTLAVWGPRRRRTVVERGPGGRTRYSDSSTEPI